MAEEGKEGEEKKGEKTGLAEPSEDWFFRPFREMDKMFEDMDRKFNRFFGRPLMRSEDRFRMPSMRAPMIDMKDRGKDYLIEAELPGVDKEDIEIEVRDDNLTIEVEKEEEKKEEGEDFIRQERGYRSFYRRIPMPDDVIPDKSEATLENGVLNISLPKKEPEKKKGRKIEVK